MSKEELLLKAYIATLVAALEAIAMLKGIDGTFFGITMALLGALAGVSIENILKQAKNKKEGQ